MGLWQRDSIVFDGGRCDAETQVFWAQTSSIFIDLRIPADRPGFKSNDLTLLTENELCVLGEQKGFAGRLYGEGHHFTWKREIDFRPPNPRSDNGIIKIIGDNLYEEGDPTAILGEQYKEIYTRRQTGDHRRIALELMQHSGAPFCGSAAKEAFLVIIDDSFMFARSRPNTLRQAETLSELLVEARRNGTPVDQLIDCHIVKGQISNELEFEILLSTHPWTEGKNLFEIASAEIDGEKITLDHASCSSVWRIHDSNISHQKLSEIFKSSLDK